MVTDSLEITKTFQHNTYRRDCSHRNTKQHVEGRHGTGSSPSFLFHWQDTAWEAKMAVFPSQERQPAVMVFFTAGDWQGKADPPKMCWSVQYKLLWFIKSQFWRTGLDGVCDTGGIQQGTFEFQWLSPERALAQRCELHGELELCILQGASSLPGRQTDNKGYGELGICRTKWSNYFKSTTDTIYCLFKKMTVGSGGALL